MDMDNDQDIKKLQKKVKKLEAALKIVSSYSGKQESRMKKQFRTVSDTIPVPLVIAGKSGKIVFVNPKAEEIFGFSREEFRQLQAESLYEQPDDRKRLIKTVSKDGELKGIQINLKKKDGTVFPASLFSQEIFFEDQDCMLTVVHDLTEIMALEKQLRITQKMEAIGTLAGGIAHDFNNILQIIFGKLQLLLMMVQDNSNVSKYIKDALEAAHRAKAMTTQILTFCRQKDQERKPIKISSIVSEASKMAGDLIRSNIKVVTDIRAKHVIVLGDPTQIHQVVMNLCANANYALQATGGEIWIMLQELFLQNDQMMIPHLDPGKYVRLTVRDNGPGMPKGVLDRVFDPFYTTKAPGEGTGMGLAVVHGIVQNHGGAVSAESEPGRGAAFHCYFPVLDEIEEMSHSERIEKNIIGGRERILVVDDEQVILDTTKEILETLGYQVTTRKNSPEALELFKKYPDMFNLVITDNTMPTLSGMELAKSLLKVHPTIPIILCTGSNDQIQQNDLNAITAILMKPFDINELANLIRTILD